jgi:hypothetical protein
VNHMARTLGLALGLLSAVSGAALTETVKFHTYLTKDGTGIAVRPAAAGFGKDRGTLEALPRFDPYRGSGFQVDLRGRDLTGLDLRERRGDLQHSIFNSWTKWPTQLPADFDPTRVLARNQTPGLGLRALHRQGITGKGVGVAIVDQELLVSHVEYADRLKLYEEIHGLAQQAEMHGPVVASIAVGRTLGVAPEADLYYIAHAPIPDTVDESAFETGEIANDYTSTAQGIRRLLEINRKLPPEHRIRAIAISLGFMKDWAGYQEVTEAIAAARKERVFVTCVNMEEFYGVYVGGLSHDMLKDPDAVENCELPAIPFGPGYLEQRANQEWPQLMVPQSARTFADAAGDDRYFYMGDGGASWRPPFLAGLYALACQVKPEITPEEFLAKAVETGETRTITVKGLSEEEIRARAAEQADGGIARLKADLPGEAFARKLGETYSRMNPKGEKRESMSEDEFRAWLTPVLVERLQKQSGGGTHQLGVIVNPTRLLASLQAGRPEEHRAEPLER